jgi:hypothetical protein
MATNKPEQVRRRRVFYIPGYDPIPPRRYRELYRKESGHQAAISSYTINLKPKRRGNEAYGWHVQAQIEGTSVETDVDVLVWSDIVRSSMSNTVAATYLALIRTVWVYIGSGTLRRLMRLRKGPVIAALYPVAMLVAQLLVAMFCLWSVVGVLVWFGGLFEQLIWDNPEFTPLFYPIRGIALGAGLLCALYVLRWFKAHDGRLYAYYLMHDYAYTARLNGANPPELEARMQEFGNLIADALTQDVDEVLVVGHSSGAYLAVSVLADLIRAGKIPKDGPALGFLSLGQVVPMISFLPDAHRLRADLRYLSARDELAWIDVSAPGDGCAFALCDPVSVSGVAPPNKKWPLVFSAAFTQTLSPERWSKLRWRFFRLHFQYLCAFDRPGDYDYFRITAGPQTLAARYADRAASKMRIDVPVSKYTSVRAA